MFDVAYLPEASVDAARIEISKLWEKIPNMDLQKSWAGFFELMEIARYRDIIIYWNFIYYTHGGI